MPVVSTLGAMSSRGFGEFNQQAQGNYIEDYFSTYLYTGNGGAQTISNGIGLSDTATWSAYRLVSSGYDVNNEKVKCDSSGNVYVASTGPSATITKYNSSGVVQWQRRFTNTSCGFRGVAVDSSGNVYASGYAYISAKFYILLVKYNSSGTIQWQRKLGDGTYNSLGYDVAVDSSGNAYVLGQGNSGSTFICLAKYNSSGTIQWQKTILQAVGFNAGYSLTIDTSDNLYIAGATYDSANSVAMSILLKVDTSGAILLQRRIRDGSFNVAEGKSVAVDTSGNIYFGGYNNTTSFLVKYNSSGTLQWQRRYYVTTGAGGEVLDLAVDSSGNVYSTGYINQSVGNPYWFVLKHNSSGTLQWQRKIDTTDSASNYSGRGIAVDSSGNLYTSGYYLNGSNLAGITLKLAADGTTTSGFAFVNLFVGNATENASSLTSATPTATSNNSSLPESAAGLTDAAGDYTASTATQAAVTGAAGLVWMKGRSGATDHALYDTARGATFDLASNTTAAQTTQSTGLTSFTSSGFTIGSLASINTSAATYASWTFRKQPKFFDVLTYTGTGVAQTINHSLGSTPGFIIIKRTDAVAQWPVWHTSLPANNVIFLNQTTATQTVSGYVTAVSSTTFSIGTQGNVNASGGSYVAYLFAHNAGGFGADGSQNVISCGSFTTDGSGNIGTVNLGYEPQYILFKKTNAAQNWYVFDVMRGWTVSGVANGLVPNAATAELDYAGGTNYFVPTATGFSGAGNFFGLNAQVIYMAIRRGPMRTPTSGTSVFAPLTRTGTGANVTYNTPNFAPDTLFSRARTGGQSWASFDRLRGGYPLIIPSTSAEDNTVTNAVTGYINLGFTFGIDNTGSISGYVNGNTFSYIYDVFQRAPGFFDVVCFTESAGTQSHNLGVSPELVILKTRNSLDSWYVFVNQDGYGILNSTSAWVGLGNGNGLGPNLANVTSTTLSKFGVFGTSTAVAYLFATCPGVSKVGTYTGTGATQTISCGFTGGARYVLIKRTDSTGDWWVWDTARGMVAGTDPRLPYNSTAAETNANWVYTTTGGFQIVTSDATVNASGGTYIYLAIA